MKNNFWLERWQREEIGFHQDEINPYLQEYWGALHIPRGNRVFVPLCGKSRDMHWLHQQGYQVLGVELSEIAVQAYFRENGLVQQRSRDAKFIRYEAEGVRILCGDFFDLTRQDLEKSSAVYDRAALIALPPEIRMRYVAQLLSILPPATPLLLITVNYPQHEMDGPPFSVPVDEVNALYQKNAEVRLLSQQEVLEKNPRFRERGLSRLQENVFLITWH